MPSPFLQEANSGDGLFLSRRTVIPDVNNAQKELSPAAVSGLNPVNLGEGGRFGQPELLGAGCFCRANRISRPTWRQTFFAAFTMI